MRKDVRYMNKKSVSKARALRASGPLQTELKLIDSDEDCARGNRKNDRALGKYFQWRDRIIKRIVLVPQLIT